MIDTFVTCLCLTRNRREWLPKAIECFQAQTYENRELLILADGESVADLVPYYDGRIRLVEIEPGLTIGAKRNVGVVRALGQIIAHWDDDDYSSPGRLNDQVERLLSSGMAVTGYCTMVFTGPEPGERHICQRSTNYALGTSLCYRRDWALNHPFADKQIGEDNAFGSRAATEKQLICVPGDSMMSAAVHAGNTSVKRVDYMKRL